MKGLKVTKIMPMGLSIFWGVTWLPPVGLESKSVRASSTQYFLYRWKEHFSLGGPPGVYTMLSPFSSDPHPSLHVTLFLPNPYVQLSLSLLDVQFGVPPTVQKHYKKNKHYQASVLTVQIKCTFWFNGGSKLLHVCSVHSQVGSRLRHKPV